jgi:transposase
MADVVSLGSSSDDEEDNEGGISGLLCPHAGCQLRFLDWASFDEHAQLPHNDGPRTSNDGEISKTNAITDFNDLQETRNSLKQKRIDNEASSARCS